MKITLKLEYLTLFILGIFAYAQLEKPWWIFLALFFVPDISMLGYLINNKAGAFFYNLFHHFGTGILCFLLGKYLMIENIEIAGIILFTHSAFDRIVGYGLKYEQGFGYTHLGRIGKNKND